MTRPQLLEMLMMLGVKIAGNDPVAADCEGEDYPLRVGTFGVDLPWFFARRELGEHPFGFPLDSMGALYRSMGAYGIAPVELALWAIARHVASGGALPTLPTWIAGLNVVGGGSILALDMANGPLRITAVAHNIQASNIAGLPWYFAPAR
ncbi:MAG: hypothetical protein WC773_00765 [Patescibacteria group bacterium]|jgi:hypothetical protein